jgi:predicted metal-dependent hydrolase
VEYQIVRSAKRKKTISATMQNGVLVLRVPRGLTKREELEWVEKMRSRLGSRQQGRRVQDDAFLKERAKRLCRRYLQQDLEFAICWSENQKSRWGSCTTLIGDIRISTELQKFPGFVLDYVIVHELAHLLVPDHSAEFWSWVNRFPATERARGFLCGYSWGRDRQNQEGDCLDGQSNQDDLLLEAG